MRRRLFSIIAIASLAGADAATAQSLRGSATSLARQNRQARAHDYSYLETAADVRRFVRAGYLVPIRENGNFELGAVSFPYARPEVQIFLDRLGAQYRRACGETLVVTSLVRPSARQPWNASDRSVHPTGMAIDLRRSTDRACREWLEDVLLHLERRGVAEATRERRPPHYHVALFPHPYIRYIGGSPAAARAIVRAAASTPAVEPEMYRVRRGDSLWSIARQYGTTVARLKALNGLDTSRVLAGQVLRVPSGGT